MRTHFKSIVRLASVVAFTAATPLALTPSLAIASGVVDQTTLNPPPPDFFNATCVQRGRNIVCSLAFADEPIVDEPLGLACEGTEILLSQDRSVVGKRFYNADGDLVQRHFRESLSGTLSNPATHKVLLWSQHDTVIHNLAVPGDLLTGTVQFTGAAIRVYRPDGGTVLVDAGRILVDAASDTIVDWSGPHHFDDYFARGDTDALAAVCAALS